jgi:hypothetical protein
MGLHHDAKQAAAHSFNDREWGEVEADEESGWHGESHLLFNVRSVSS